VRPLKRWARDVAGEFHILIRSARSLLTVMTHVTGVGMAVDPIVIRDSQTSSDVIAGIATATSIASVVAEIEIGIVIDFGIAGIGNIINGVVGDRHS